MCAGNLSARPFLKNKIMANRESKHHADNHDGKAAANRSMKEKNSCNQQYVGDHDQQFNPNQNCSGKYRLP